MAQTACFAALFLLSLILLTSSTTFRVSKYGEEEIIGHTLEELTDLFDEYGKFQSGYAEITEKIKEMKELDPRFNYLFSVARITDAEEDELYELIIEYLGPIMQRAAEKEGFYLIFE